MGGSGSETNGQVAPTAWAFKEITAFQDQTV